LCSCSPNCPGLIPMSRCVLPPASPPLEKSSLQRRQDEKTEAEALTGTCWTAGQDGSGWTALMIAASVADSEPILTLLLQRGADVNEKSESPSWVIPHPYSRSRIT